MDEPLETGSSQRSVEKNNRTPRVGSSRRPRYLLFPTWGRLMGNFGPNIWARRSSRWVQGMFFERGHTPSGWPGYQWLASSVFRPKFNLMWSTALILPPPSSLLPPAPTLPGEPMANDYWRLWMVVTNATDGAQAIQALAEILTDREGKVFISCLGSEDAELCVEILGNVSPDLYSRCSRPQPVNQGIDDESLPPTRDTRLRYRLPT